MRLETSGSLWYPGGQRQLKVDSNNEALWQVQTLSVLDT